MYTGILHLQVSDLEEHILRYLNRIISTIILASAVAAPAAVMAAPLPQEANVQVRVYDRDHHDYHYWNEHEDHAYREYLEGRHRTYVVYEHQNHKVQNHYWQWRHSHPDHD
jgi:Ni/Co efflux regulator RcnB